jgi:outer membrane protein
MAQTSTKQWDLSGCIQYALTNNIQIQKAKVTLQSNEVSTKESKAALLPNLSASIGQNLSTYPFASTSGYTGSYGVSSSMLLFDGGKTSKTISQSKLNEDVARYSILASEKSIQMSILQNYAQILYADEAVKVYQETVKTSEYQYERGKAMLKAGSISGVDLAQLESQLSSDKYQLVVAQNTLSTAKLALKQLLELNLSDEMNLSIPELGKVDVLKPLSSLQTIYETALNAMPQIKSDKTNIQISSLDTEKAKAGYLPKVSLTGSAGTSHSTGVSANLGDQISKGFNAGVGVSVSIPIFSNRQNKSAVEKAVLNEKTAKLNMQDTEKNLLTEIESVYQNALSAQSQYQAASEKVKALETSYNLIEQQFGLGMKNTLELLTEKNSLLSARQSQMQAKYLSIANMQILNLYQDIPVDIK